MAYKALHDPVTACFSNITTFPRTCCTHCLFPLSFFPSPGDFPFLHSFCYISKHVHMYTYHSSPIISMYLKLKFAYQPCSSDILATLVIFLFLGTPRSLYLPQDLCTLQIIALLIFEWPYPCLLALNSNVTFLRGLSRAPYWNLLYPITLFCSTTYSTTWNYVIIYLYFFCFSD